ncbi:MAG: 2-oxo acid dehydrogenase subunit E2 [Myxococcota bacterium]
MKLGFLGFFATAVVEALKAYLAVNAEVRGDTIVYKHHCWLPGRGGGRCAGLVVPVVKAVDELGLAEFEKALGVLADKAKNNTLALADLQGASTFTISNGGVYGSPLSTPILNSAVGRHPRAPQDRGPPWSPSTARVVIRPMMYSGAERDHRIVDGREAVSLVKVKQCIEDPARILLEV